MALYASRFIVADTHVQSTDGANAGLEHARAFLDPIAEANPWISYADLWSESL